MMCTDTACRRNAAGRGPVRVGPTPRRRAGPESRYDPYLRSMPGERSVYKPLLRRFTPSTRPGLRPFRPWICPSRRAGHRRTRATWRSRRVVRRQRRLQLRRASHAGTPTRTGERSRGPRPWPGSAQSHDTAPSRVPGGLCGNPKRASRSGYSTKRKSNSCLRAASTARRNSCRRAFRPDATSPACSTTR